MSKKIPPPITDSAKLQAYSAEHLVYELQMFFGAVRTVHSGSSIRAAVSSDLTTTTTPSVRLSGFVGKQSSFQKNATIEVFALHLRNLITFLYPDRYSLKPDDVAAHHFISAEDPWNEWLAVRPCLSDALRDAKQRADKELAHITTQRISGAPSEKEWAIAALAGEMASLLNVFVETADPSRLAARVSEELKKYPFAQRPDAI